MPIHALHVPRPGFSMHPVAILSAPERLALIHPRGRRLLPAVQRAMDVCRNVTRVRGQEISPSVPRPQ
jgi:hypothetical protein